MKKTLIIASGLSANEYHDYDYADNGWTIVAVNSAWQVCNDWTYWVHTNDYDGPRPTSLNPEQVEIWAKHENPQYEYCRVLNKYGGQYQCGIGISINASYWVLDVLKPDILGYLGNDLTYTPNENGNTHFYGVGRDIKKNGIPDPVFAAKHFGKGNPNYIWDLYCRFDTYAKQAGCKVVNLSTAKETRLPYERMNPRDVTMVKIPSFAGHSRYNIPTGAISFAQWLQNRKGQGPQPLPSTGKIPTLVSFYTDAYEQYLPKFIDMTNRLGFDHYVECRPEWQGERRWNTLDKNYNSKWKPYVIENALKEHELCLWVDIDTDIHEINKVLSNEHDIGIFDNPVQWHQNKISAGWIWFRKSATTLLFLKQWQDNLKKYNRDHPALTETLQSTTAQIADMTGTIALVWNGHEDDSVIRKRENELPSTRHNHNEIDSTSADHPFSPVKPVQNATILTAYLTSQRDRHMNTQHQPNDPKYIKNIYTSCKKSKTPCIVLVDFDCAFADTEYVKFVHFDYFRDETPHLRRFKLFRKFIEENSYDAYLTCDCHDVAVLRNPFIDVLNKRNNLYVGSETDMDMMKNLWIGKHFPTLGVEFDHFKNKQLLNCGILGGYRHLLLEFLDTYISTFNAIYSPQFNPAVVDMFSFNKVLYESYPKAFVTGSPLHTEFNAFDLNNKEACIAHK